MQAIDTAEQKLTSSGEFCFTAKYGPVKIPKCQAQAHASEHAEKWKAAEKKEMDKLKKFGTFEDVSVDETHDAGYEVHHLLWAYRIKTDAEGDE